MPELHRVVYCSRNTIPGGEASLRRELARILESARRNNGARGVTGALLYNGGYFAQILEGPRGEVEEIFEAIQNDDRHSDITVIENSRAAARMFPEWSMAFAAHCPEGASCRVTETFEAVFEGPARASNQLLNLLKELVTEEGEWEMSGRPEFTTVGERRAR